VIWACSTCKPYTQLQAADAMRDAAQTKARRRPHGGIGAGMALATSWTGLTSGYQSGSAGNGGGSNADIMTPPKRKGNEVYEDDIMAAIMMARSSEKGRQGVALAKTTLKRL